MKISQDEIVNHLKTYGFIFNSSEIYNGLANAWDYGPLGVLLKDNIKQLWTKYFVYNQSNVYCLDSAIILNPLVWKASGHLTKFCDPLLDCKNCKKRFRADKLIEAKAPGLNVSEHLSNEQYQDLLKKYEVKCPNCNEFAWTDIREFNLMYKTYQGVTQDNLSELYLRPETAQGIFINFKNVQRTMRAKVPFGIAQIGKSFRNEITPGNFIFRTREFEQMELEYFVHPNEAPIAFETLVNDAKTFLWNWCKINPDHLNFHEQTKDELAHYASRTIDIQYDFPHGMSELWGIANRTDHDLKQHMAASNEDFNYVDPKTNEKFIPYVIEPSVGVERLMYAICTDVYEVQPLENNDSRAILHFPNWLAPIKLAVLPLVNKLNDHAFEIFNQLLNKINGKISFDTSGSIGKRYRRQDAIGTPFCLTVDFETLDANMVTIRMRDSMEQIKLKIDEVANYINNNIMFH